MAIRAMALSAAQGSAKSAWPFAQQVATWLGMDTGDDYPALERAVWQNYRAYVALAFLSVLSTVVWLAWLALRPSK
jgi:membrane protein required for beta-lactamase induction